jgi:hypothetical protein
VLPFLFASCGAFSALAPLLSLIPLASRTAFSALAHLPSPILLAPRTALSALVHWRSLILLALSWGLVVFAPRAPRPCGAGRPSRACAREAGAAISARRYAPRRRLRSATRSADITKKSRSDFIFSISRYRSVGPPRL